MKVEIYMGVNPEWWRHDQIQKKVEKFDPIWPHRHILINRELF